MLHIRKATLEDIETLIKVGSQAFVETFAEHNTEADMQAYLSTKFTQEQLNGEFNEPNATFFIAEYDSQAAGYAKLRTVEEPAQLVGKKHLELERLYVLKAFHNKKIGKELMETCITLAKQNDFEVLWLGVWEHNLKALEFYHKWGFERFDEHIFQLGEDKQTDYLMKLELKSNA